MGGRKTSLAVMAFTAQGVVVVVGDILQQTRGSNRRGREDLVHGGGPHRGSGSSMTRS
jgi:hypothetical protein